MTKDGSYPNAAKEISKRLEAVKGQDFEKNHVTNALSMLNQFMEGMSNDSREDSESAARTFSFSLGNIMAATLLLEHASNSDEECFKLVAKRFCERNLCEVGSLTSLEIAQEYKIIFED